MKIQLSFDAENMTRIHAVNKWARDFVGSSRRMIRRPKVVNQLVSFRFRLPIRNQFQNIQRHCCGPATSLCFCTITLYFLHLKLAKNYSETGFAPIDFNYGDSRMAPIKPRKLIIFRLIDFILFFCLH